MSARCEPTYKVTVPVSTLVGKIEAYIASSKAKHAKALLDHDKAVERFHQNAATRLKVLAEDAAKGKLPRPRYEGSSIEVNLGVRPQKPSLSIGQAEKDLALLKSASETTLSIKGQDHLAVYL